MGEQTHPGALFAALAKAQASMDNVLKDSANPHFKSKFASLAAVRDVVVKACSEQGIAVVQMPGNDEQGRVTIRTMLLHESGTFDCGTVATTATVRGGNEAQAVGSALTYLRRYALAAIAGVAQEDDDGNASGPRGGQPRRQHQRGPSARELLSGGGRNSYSAADVGAMLAEVYDRSPDGVAAAEAFVQKAVGLEIARMMDMQDARNAVAVALREEWK